MNSTKQKPDVRNFISRFSIYIVLVIMIVISSILSPYFISSDNIINIIRQLAIGTILAFGEMILITAGQIDLSSGAVLALSGILSIASYQSTHSLFIAFIVAIIVSVICNILNAVMVTNFNAPAFIATLAMTYAARGAALLYTKGQNILQIGDYTIFGQGSVGIIPMPVIFLIIVALIIAYIMRNTRFGRSIYAIGGNEPAAVASGINVHKVKYTAFIINGILVGIAGVLFMSRVNAGLPNGGVGYEMTGITATIVGGTSFTGGIGTTIGTIVGSFIIGILNNIMTLTGVDSYVQQIVTGVVIAFAVIYDIQSKKKKSNKIILSEDSDKGTAKT